MYTPKTLQYINTYAYVFLLVLIKDKLEMVLREMLPLFFYKTTWMKSEFWK